MTRTERLKAMQKLATACGALTHLKKEMPSTHTAFLTLLQFYADMAYKSFMSANATDLPIMAHRYHAVHKMLDSLSETVANPEKWRESLHERMATILRDEKELTEDE